MVVAIVVFIGATLIATMQLPDVDRSIRWELLALMALVGVPATVALNTAEYAFSAGLLGHSVRFGEALRTSLIASAANQLPIPGSVLVRVGALRRLGSSYARASASTATVGLAWIGATGILAGAAQLPSGARLLGLVLFLVGLLAVFLSYLMVRVHVGSSGAARMMLQVLLVEIGSVLASAARFYLVLLALGFGVAFPQALALTVAVVVASAAGFLPGGLGVRELLAAAISPLIGLPAAVGLLATAIDRLAALGGLSILALVLLWRGPRARA
jgi:uncharacterized membrane protein YbhN (UPF0104 family)